MPDDRKLAAEIAAWVERTLVDAPDLTSETRSKLARLLAATKPTD